jgi:hypothetical protein
MHKLPLLQWGPFQSSFWQRRLIFMAPWQQYHPECDVLTHFWLPMDGAAACRTYPIQWCAPYVTLQNISHIHVLVIYFASNTTQTPQNWACCEHVRDRLRCSNSKPPGQIIKIEQSENGRSSWIIFITLLSCNSL